MNVDLDFYSSFCEAKVFRINGVDADENDFGEKYDRSPDEAEDDCCGDMKFTAIPPRSEVLEKYGITAEEYAFIAGLLEDGLSFGCCGFCE